MVLTFSAPEALETCLRALAHQHRRPDALLVVDNAGDPPARTVIDGFELPFEVELVRADRNSGPAGGHATGLRRFLERTESSVWVLDDDMIPEPGCLRALEGLLGAAERPSFALPVIDDRSDGTERRWPAWCGVLLPRAAVERVGVPCDDLVWWAEDTEYLQWRLPRAGFEPRWASGARVTHQRVRRRGASPVWMTYYETRNSVFVRLHVKGQWGRPGRLARTLAAILWRILSRDDHKTRRLVAYARGLVDGTRGRLGLTVPLG